MEAGLSGCGTCCLPYVGIALLVGSVIYQSVLDTTKACQEVQSLPVHPSHHQVLAVLGRKVPAMPPPPFPRAVE